MVPDTSSTRILVVGDVMLDRYWFGEVSRISPEAPVPVVKVERSEERPGGAANVARNCAALGARVVLLSVVGVIRPVATRLGEYSKHAPVQEQVALTDHHVDRRVRGLDQFPGPVALCVVSAAVPASSPAITSR